MTEQRNIDIRVPVLARVEGEGALEIQTHGLDITTLRLRIFEPPRLFEKILEGRDHGEVPDLVARICGICPVAYQMSAVHAFERLFDVDPGSWVRDMRRVLYCGEWLQSHALHIHLLAAPDLLGYGNAIAMARDYPDIVRRGLLLQALGNDIIRLFGARSVHPVGVRVGGFHHVPACSDVTGIYTRLSAAIPEAEALVRWVAALDLPAAEQRFVSVSLRHTAEYPMNAGRLASSDGLDAGIDEFESHFSEQQVAHSTALYCLLKGQPYLVGPLARVNLNLERLPAAVRAVLDDSGIVWPSRNPFHAIVARAAEIYYAVLEAARILKDYRVAEAPHAAVVPRAGTAIAGTEAPRGMLWHRYDVQEDGRVVRARIVPPTSQNQARIEADLRQSLEALGPDRSDDELRRRCEMVIRSYDPCISCATHFLDLRVERR